MNWFEALILGIVQGLTEYLPVSSSGHLAIGSYLFGIDGADNLAFTVLVHVATVLSTFVVLWSEIDWILKGLFKFKMNDETKYFINILVSMIPIGIVGLFFKDTVEEIFGSGLGIVGCMLLLTAGLLIFSYFAQPRQKEKISWRDALIIGVAQACAVMPGLSLYDFGDMVRTCTSPAEEDEIDLSKVYMQFNMYEALFKGFCESANRFMTPAEKENLALAGKIITLEIGTRFLTDYLNGDVYFKIKRPDHNLDRCRSQLQLVRSIEEQMDSMQKLLCR